MSRNVYRIDTFRKQFEIANLIMQLDHNISSVKSRVEAISSKAVSVNLPEPVPILDLREGSHPVLNLTRELDLSPIRGLIREEASKISKELEKHIESIAIMPIQISMEKRKGRHDA